MRKALDSKSRQTEVLWIMKRIGWAAVFLQCAVFIQGVSGAVAQDAARSIEIHAKRFSFSPAEITLNEGETVKLVVTSGRCYTQPRHSGFASKRPGVKGSFWRGDYNSHKSWRL
jgi:plastocyanin